MASLVSPTTGNRVKKWRARVKVDGYEYYLGVYTSKKKAEERENFFRTASQGKLASNSG